MMGIFFGGEGGGSCGGIGIMNSYAKIVTLCLNVV